MTRRSRRKRPIWPTVGGRLMASPLMPMPPARQAVNVHACNMLLRGVCKLNFGSIEFSFFPRFQAVANGADAPDVCGTECAMTEQCCLRKRSTLLRLAINLLPWVRGGAQRAQSDSRRDNNGSALSSSNCAQIRQDPRGVALFTATSSQIELSQRNANSSRNFDLFPLLPHAFFLCDRACARGAGSSRLVVAHRVRAVVVLHARSPLSAIQCVSHVSAPHPIATRSPTDH